MITWEKRFWEKVDKNGPVPSHCRSLGRCWIWTGAVNGSMKYGVLRLAGKNVQAHVLSWLLHFGPLKKPCVLHRCDNPPCVNPAHLWNGTKLDNFRDMKDKGRHQFGIRHHARKLTPLRVRWIRQNYIPRDRVFGLRSMARSYGVSIAAVVKAFHKKTWREVLS